MQENGVSIWNEWADENGELGRAYGAQWTAWQKPNGEFVNQINQVIQSISDNPDGRRHIVCAVLWLLVSSLTSAHDLGGITLKPLVGSPISSLIDPGPFPLNTLY